MSNHQNEAWSENELEMCRERLDRAISGIMEADKKLKEIDAKIAERKEFIKKTGVMNLGDIGLLPLIW